MSTSDNIATTWTPDSSSEEGAPANSPKRLKITATSQETAVASFEGWGRVSIPLSKIMVKNEQVDMKRIRDEVWLTKIDQFFPEPVKKKIK